MRKTIFTLAVMVCMAFTISTSFGQEPDKKTEKAKENLQDEKKDVVAAQKDLTEAQNDDYLAFNKESDLRIKNNEKSIADLNDKISNIENKDKAKNQIRVNDLETKNFSLQKDLIDYKDEGQEKWATFKFKFNYDMVELEKALKDFTVDSEK
jgi:hypothetical protein